MRDILNQIALSPFSEKQIEELQLTGTIYTKLNNMGNKKRNKSIIGDVFDLIIEHFYIGDLKLKFGENLGFNDDAVYIENLNGSYEETFIDILKKVIIAYFKRIDDVYMSIEESVYKLIKLSILNNDEEMIDKLVNNVAYELIDDMGLNIEVNHSRILKKDIANLIVVNNQRNKKLIETCCYYYLDEDLTSYQIRNVFSCFSSDVFNKANVKQKAYLMNLVYNYFNFSSENRVNKYKKVITNEFDNVDALEYIVNDLSLKDNTNNINAIRNLKLLEDFKSGFKYIVKNETNKAAVSRLDEVSIKNINKK
jgi:hypothetical protein